MKNLIKKIYSLLLASLIVISSPLISFAEPVNVVINSKLIKSDVPAQIIEGRTLVPLSSILHELEANVVWNEEKQMITARKEDTVIEIIINNKTAYVNGKATAIDVAPIILNGRTLVPLSFLSTSLGADVSWDSKTKTAMISTNGAISNSISQAYKVIKVVDGDTIKIIYNGKEEYVRMIGIDTPESVHPDKSKNVEAGKTASEFTTKMLLDKDIELEFDVEQRDKYQRLLGYVYIDGKMFNKTLLEEGYAVIATYPPNVKYVDEFKAISSKSNPVLK